MLTRPSLLLRIRQLSDSDSWSEFVEIYGRIVYGYCRRRGLTDADAADVVQEVMAQVAESIGSFEYDRNRGRFRGWLGSVTISKINRLRRSAAHNAECRGAGALPLQDIATESDSQWVEQFGAGLLQVALDRVRPSFEPETWEAFESVWVRDRPVAEVARRMGRPVYAIYTAKSRVLSRLRAEIASLADDVPALVPLGN